MNSCDWYDYDKQEAIALPPVGVECLMLHPGIEEYGWQKVSIKAYFDKKVVIMGSSKIWDYGLSITSIDKDLNFRPLDHATRKAEADKKRVVDAVYTIIDQHEGTILESVGELYDKGFLKMPGDK